MVKRGLRSTATTTTATTLGRVHNHRTFPECNASEATWQYKCLFPEQDERTQIHVTRSKAAVDHCRHR